MDAIRLTLIVIRSGHLEAMAAFYGALGVRFVRHRHGTGPEHLSAEVDGGVVFESYPRKPGDESTMATRIGFGVNSVDEACTSVAKAGGRIVSVPKIGEWGLRAVVDDPEGHRVELTQRKSNADGSSALHDI
ncbi:MAG: VOC family protein [Prosthecobacter sp.]|uniref:VOC family protein n=1 Tax=Prosthecobacter sp. TaxID=1965333 RepID=UPI003900EE1D